MEFLGNAVIELLHLKGKANGLVETDFGDKSKIGLGLTIDRILEDYDHEISLNKVKPSEVQSFECGLLKGESIELTNSKGDIIHVHRAKDRYCLEVNGMLVKFTKKYKKLHKKLEKLGAYSKQS
jgi:hypothetical protein